MLNINKRYNCNRWFKIKTKNLLSWVHHVLKSMVYPFITPCCTSLIIKLFAGPVKACSLTRLMQWSTLAVFLSPKFWTQTIPARKRIGLTFIWSLSQTPWHENSHKATEVGAAIILAHWHSPFNDWIYKENIFRHFLFRVLLNLATLNWILRL